jgi:hypothetical protein
MRTADDARKISLSMHRNITQHRISIASLLTVADEWAQVRVLFEQGVLAGVVQPLAHTVYTVDQLSDALEHTADKAVVCVRNEDAVKPTAMPTVHALGRALANPKLTYVIVGALESPLGVELAQWLVERGARRC